MYVAPIGPVEEGFHVVEDLWVLGGGILDSQEQRARHKLRQRPEDYAG